MSATKAAKLTAPGRYAVGDGVHLLVSPSGARSWLLRIMVDGRRRDYGLGGAGVDIAQARDKAADIRQRLGRDEDPLAPAPEAMTFGRCATEYVELHRSGWKSAKHQAQWTSTIETYCAGFLALPVAEVTRQHVLDALQPHWATKHETMFRLRGRIRAVLEHAMARGYRADGVNPADRLSLPKVSRTRLVKHHPSLPWREVPAFVQRLQAEQQGVAALALRFAILTAARSGEARGCDWSEVDMDLHLWTVPPIRMKGGRPHKQPLSAQALGILQAMPHRTGLVFPSTKPDTPLSDMALLQVCRRMQVQAVPHGFRASFSTWTADCTEASFELREACLAHVSGDRVSAAYQRSDFLDKRRQHMQAWADWVEPR